MCSKKLLILAAVALAIAVVSVSASTFRTGRRQARDGVVCYGSVDLRGRPGVVLNTQRICNVPWRNQTINMIEAIDRNRVGKGGYAQIIKGGLYQKNVTLYFWSQTGQDLNFTINVYGVPFY